MTPCLVPLPAQLIKTLIRWIDVASDQRLVGCWFPILFCFLWLFGVVFFFNDTLASSTVVYHLKWSHHLLNWTMFVSFVMKTWHFLFFSYLFFFKIVVLQWRMRPLSGHMCLFLSKYSGAIHGADPRVLTRAFSAAWTKYSIFIGQTMLGDGRQLDQISVLSLG